MVFPVVMYGCKSWTIKKAECRRIDNFDLRCWEKTSESPLDCKEIKSINSKGNQSWIFIGGTDAEAKVPKFWPPNAKNWLTGKKSWCWEILKAGRVGPNRGWDGWMASPAQWTWVWASSGRWLWTGNLTCHSPCGCKESDTTQWLNNSHVRKSVC